MRAVLIAVGSELLRPGASDTNGPWLASRLERLGIPVAWRTLVGDEESRIAARLREAIGEVELVVVTGGLGPTEDDRTRAGIAAACGRALARDPARESELRARGTERGHVWTEAQARQALRPEGAAWLPNPVGTAPGLRLQVRGALLVALPGVPEEARAMFETAVEPELASRAREALASRVFKIAGRPESAADAAVRDVYGRPGVDLTILVAPRGVELHLRCRGATDAEARERLEVLDREIAGRLGDDLFGRDEETLPSVVGAALLERGRTVATGESCTAGLLGGALTEVPGASAWYRGGIVSYHDRVKVALGGVTVETLERWGAVSEPAALEMASGARDRLGADYGIGVTGIAGPTGGTEAKPVGLVHAAVVGPEGRVAVRLRLSGGREAVRQKSVTAALDLLRRHLRAR